MFATVLNGIPPPVPTKVSRSEEDCMPLCDATNRLENGNLRDIIPNPAGDQLKRGSKENSITTKSLDDTVAPKIKVAVNVNLKNDKKAINLFPKLAAAWIIPFQQKQVWPNALEEVFPKEIQQRMDSKSMHRRSLEERLACADMNREKYLFSVSATAMRHNNHVAHARLVNQDIDQTLRVHIGEKLAARLAGAQNRRESFLMERQNCANAFSMPVYDTEHTMGMERDLQGDSTRRIEFATKRRNELLKLRSRKAGLQAEHAKVLAVELAKAEELYSERLKYEIDQKIQRAEIRRSIFLDRRRLAAGRHSNYVKSVYLTNKYMERRTGQIIQHNLEAATFRREVHLEEIRSNARQHNLSAQFRACCAYRLFDAKWLNKALRSTAAQTTAKMRRELNLEALMKRLHEAESHRADVLATYKLAQLSSEEIEAKYNARQFEAAERRTMFLLRRSHQIQERAIMIRARKSTSRVLERKVALDAITYRLAMATKRREAFLERKRAKCARRNWYTKVQVQQHAEDLRGNAQCRLMALQERLDAADLRRAEAKAPIFAQLNALRATRCKNVWMLREAALKKWSIWKSTAIEERITAIIQFQIRSALKRADHFREVQSRRQRMENFRRQCIASAMFARTRTAEIRRSLYQDSIRASAEDALQRGEIGRMRLAYRKQRLHERLARKMENATSRRQENLTAIVSSARWFQQKAVQARERIDKKISILRTSSSQAVANASLRRSIILTRIVQTNAVKKAKFDKLANVLKQGSEQVRSKNAARIESAAVRRKEVLAHKTRMARITLNKVAKSRVGRRAEDIVNGAIRTAIRKTMARNAEARRKEWIDNIQQQAATQVSHAKAVAEAHKELIQVRAEATLQQSKLRVLQTSKRRDNLMTQRKLGHNTLDTLQPYSELQVVGHAMFPNSPRTA